MFYYPTVCALWYNLLFEVLLLYNLSNKCFFRRLSCVSQKVQYYSLGSSKIFKGLESSQRPLSSSASYLILILVFALMVFKYITRPYVHTTHTCTQASACSVMCMYHMFLNTEEDTKIQLTYK